MPDVAEIADRRWNRAYRCCYCVADGLSIRASIRVFAGTYGGGWPACRSHEHLAIDEALHSMLRANVVADYKVDAFRVEVDEYGYPTMTQRLFSARRKPA